MPTWLIVLLQQFVFPEVQRYFENYYAKNGKLPTLEELNTNVLTETNEGIIKGMTWLANHKEL